MDIYDLLNRIIVNRRYELSANLFVDSDKDELQDDEKEIFELVWSEDEYKKIIDSNMLSLPNPNNRIKYPKF